MTRRLAALGTAVFLVLAPGTVAGLIPWWISHWQMREMPWEYAPVRGLGILLIIIGVLVLFEAFTRFALEGRGTPAPVLPTQHLVIKGSYRYVRNPMYVALLSIVIGQSALFADWQLVVYAALVWLCSHVFVVAYEEPTLRRTYGDEYLSYCAEVPRWLPRLPPQSGS